MSNYTVTTNFAEKDGFPSGDTRKIIKGSEFAGEFNNIATASATKADLASPTFTGTVVIPTATISTANIAAGAINATSLDLQNNEKIQLGDADQLEIYSDGHNSIIKETGGGALSLRGNEVTIKNPSGTETMAFFTKDGAVSLYHDNAVKFATTATGNLSNGNLTFGDNHKIIMGVGEDLKLYHDGTNSYIEDSGAGNLRVLSSNFLVKNPADDEIILRGTSGGSVDLYYNNGKKLETTATGATVTGDISVTGDVDMPDNSKVLIGDDDNLQLYYDGTNSLIEDTNSGNLLLRGVQLKLQSYATGNEDYITCTNNGPVALFNNGAQKANTFGFGFQVAGRLEVDTPDTNTDETVIFKKDGTTCGAVRATVSSGVADITLGSGVVGLRFLKAAGGSSANISPTSVTDNSAQDDLIDLGRATARFDDIYATNGTINTSDANDKQSIEELTEAETRVAVACKGLVRKFKWNSAVESKGSEARYHFGVIAQDVQSAFEAEGLDAGDYGVFVSSTWEDEDGVEQTRLGVRYTELLAFIIGGL